MHQITDAPTIASPVLTLASASPRRRELLALFGVAFHVAPNSGEEQDDAPPQAVIAALPPCPVPLRQHPTLLAWRKTHAACTITDAPSGVIIGADTDVVIDGEVLGKPRDDSHACALLRRMAGRTHIVYTGVCVWQAASDTFQYALDASEVLIAQLSDAEIAAYVATGEPMDKAGAYGIQGLGGRLVERVVGSYTSVVGLPLQTVYRMLRAAGVTNLADPVEAYHRWLYAQGKEPLPCPPTLP